MTRAGVSFRLLVLGLLLRRSMSGYAIRRLLRSLGWLLGNPSFGTIYPALHGLLEDGLATVEVVPSPNRPARKVYTITEAGRQSVQQWVSQNPPASIGLRAFLMRLVLAGNSSLDGLVAHLRQRQEALAAQRVALEQAVEALGEQAGLGEIAAIEYGLAIATAEVAWLETKISQLSAQTHSEPPQAPTAGDSES